MEGYSWQAEQMENMPGPGASGAPQKQRVGVRSIFDRIFQFIRGSSHIYKNSSNIHETPQIYIKTPLIYTKYMGRLLPASYCHPSDMLKY